jgi:hypothetical protein
LIAERSSVPAVALLDSAPAQPREPPSEPVVRSTACESGVLQCLV